MIGAMEKRLATGFMIAALAFGAPGTRGASARAGEQVPAPAGKCAPSLQVYFASDFTDQAYQKKAYDKVAALWRRPPADPKRGSKAVVITTIAKDGKGTPPMLHMKSGSDAWDAAAMAAVKAASPFPPLPASYPQAGVEVHFHFACGG
jgi:protein TonB